MPSTEITQENFESVIAGDKPVLVDFWATWCGPCRAFGPVVEAVADEMAGELVVGKCDVDQNPELAQRFGIATIPTTILFKGGQPVHTTRSAMSKAQLLAELRQHL